MDPSTGPSLAGAVAGFLNSITLDDIWQQTAQSSIPDCFTILAVLIFLRNRRADAPTPDDTEWGSTKNSMSLLILFGDFCRYLMPIKYILESRTSVPIDGSAVAAASKLIPSIMPCIASFCNLVLIAFEPMHPRVPSPLPTLTLMTTVAFRFARYAALEDRLHSYYSDISFIILSMQLGLLAVQLFWKVVIFIPYSPAGQPQFPLWREMAPEWFATMVLLPYLDIKSIENLSHHFPPPRAYGSEPLFRQITPLCDCSVEEIRNSLTHFGFITLRRQFMSIVPARLLLIAFTYYIPYLVKDTVAFTSQKHTPLIDILKLVGLTTFIYAGRMVRIRSPIASTPTHANGRYYIQLSRAWYQQCRVRFATSLRRTLTNAMSEKLLVVSQKHAQSFGLVKLFGRDLDSIDTAAHAFHDFWSSMLELALGLYTVTSLTGASFYMGLFIPFAATLSELLIQIPAVLSADWKEAAKARIDAAYLYLRQYSELRYAGYVTAFDLPLMKLRAKELDAANREQIRRSMNLAFCMRDVASNSMAPVAIIGSAIYQSRQSDPLTISEYFAVAAVAPLLLKSWKNLVCDIRIFFTGLDGLERTQQFMKLPDLVPTDRGSSTHQSGPKIRSLQLLQTAFNTSRLTKIRYRDLCFDAGKVTMIIGPSGCGKSSLLKALLGEMQLVSGNVVTPQGPLAFCGESSFIQNLSIKDNIVFQAPFDPIWYQHVLHACTLHMELGKLPQADETMAGEGGCKINDIRQLVSLARAVYANLPVMILDETFDFFEPNTANIILTRLFGKGGLLRNKCTVVFTSSNSRDSSHANTIFAFDKMRGIQQVSRNLDNLPPHLKFDPKAFSPGPIHAGTRQSLDLRDNKYPYVDNKPNSIRSQIESEKASIFTFIAYLHSLGVFGVVVTVAVMGIAALSAKFPLYYLQSQLENYDTGEPAFFFLTWVKTCLSPLLVLPVCSAVYFLFASSIASFEWHTKLMKAVHWTSIKFVNNYGSTKLKKLYKQDVTLVSTSLASAFLIGTFLTISLVADLYYSTFNFGPISWLMVPPSLVTVCFIAMNYGASSMDLRLLDFDCKLALYNHIIDTASGAEHIRAFGWQRNFLRRTYELLDKSQRSHYYSLLIQQSLNLSLDLYVCFIAFTVVTLPLLVKGLCTEVSMGVSLVTVAGLSSVTREVVDSWMGFCSALFPIYNIGHFILETPPPKKRAVSDLDAADRGFRWPIAGDIGFHNVTAPVQLDPSLPPILDNINVTIDAGKTVGIIGTTASGKTAFLQAILGLTDYTGTITIDGTDVRQLPDQFVQQRAVVVSAYQLNFPGTLRENLDPLHGTRHRLLLSDDVIIEVLKKLALWREVVRRGATLDSPMSDMGLSTGQREVFAIARGILRQKNLNAQVVMIDGALGCVDPTLDLLVNRVMAEEFAGCTLIKVTHHLATLEDASQVIKIEKGRIHSVFQPGGRR